MHSDEQQENLKDLKEAPEAGGAGEEEAPGNAAPAKKPRKPIRKRPDPSPGRLELLRERMDQHKVEAVLIQSPENRRYFSGFKAPDAMITESSGCLLITLSGKNILLTDGRYTSAAAKEAPCFEVVAYKRGPAGQIKADGLIDKKLYFEPQMMTVEMLNIFKENLGAGAMEILPFKLGDFRIVKDPDELHYIKRAVEITEKALSLLWPELEPGVSEQWTALFLENKFRDLGAEGPAFPSIVASGLNAALPHAEPSNKKFGQNDMVVIDIGARYKGYCSDMTRTFMPWKPADWQKRVYAVVRDAQAAVLRMLSAGRTGAEADHVARKYITSRGFGEYFNHSLGHGVGLLVHEEPRLSPHSDAPLPAGSLVTVEPGIYIPGKGGVRLEQLCLLTEAGHVVLNKDTHIYRKL